MEDECVEELGRPISSMKVTELRDELTRRALTKTGNKKELIDRLRAAIQRQSSQSFSQPMEADQAIQLNQQLYQQNVPQYIAAANLQQNQVSAAYQQQINQNQPQAQLNAYSIPSDQHQQFSQTNMQPLDLQQQTIDQSQAIQSAQEIQQNLSGQQLCHDQSAAQPPIDMRVAQQSSHNDDDVTSIDLSSSAKEPNLQSQQSADDEHDQEKKELNDNKSSTSREETKNIGQEDKSLQERQSEKSEIENNAISIDQAPDELQESHTDEAVPQLPSEELIESNSTHKALDTDDKETVVESKVEKIISDAHIEQAGSSHLDQEVPVDNSKPSQDPTQPKEYKEPNEVENQSSFSLKRGVSDSRTSQSGNKEKRRKWSSKSGGDVSTAKDSSQATIMIGGISSQKLQELIDEKAAELEVKSSRQATLPSADSESLEASKDEKDEELPKEAVEDSHLSEEANNVSGDKTQDISQTDEQLDKEPEPTPRPQTEPTNVLLVQNLVRPFTITQLKEVLTKHGPIVDDKFWTDKVKSKCCVVYENVEVAKLTKESLQGQQWPSSNPKTLKISYTSEEMLAKLQSSELSKSSETGPENGNPTNDQTNKSITNRLGEKVDDVDGTSSGDLVKKRLGEKVSGEVSTKSSSVNRDSNNSKPQELDDLFKKTKAVPHLFWLPLNEEEAESRREVRIERENRVKEQAQKQARSPPRRRSPQRHRSPPNRRVGRRRSPTDRRSPPRYRSPPSRRTSPPRRSSPYRRRSPITRSPPPRRRSPMLSRRSPSSGSPSPNPPRRSPGLLRRSPGLTRRSPPRPVKHHLTGPAHRSPGPMRRSPGMLHRSPGPIRRSPGLIRRSPGPIRRSPGMIRRSPGPTRRSPGPNRRSPGLMRRSPGPIRRSPGLMRHSPTLLRRSPGLIRRSPAPIRGSSPVRRTSPGRRSPARRRSRSPVRYISPARNVGYPSEQRRIQRLDRSR